MTTKHTCEFVLLTELVPKNWVGWFWAEFSSDAPFSWGDNNRTLVTAERVLKYCKEDLFVANVPDADLSEQQRRELTGFLGALEALGNTYVDLEN